MPATVRRLALTLTTVLAAAAITSGCDTVEPAATITKQQAVERVANRAQEALRQLPPGATLQVRLHEPDTPCDPGDPRTFVESNYSLDYPEQWPVEQAIPTLAAYWRDKGYKIIKDQRDRPKTPALSVEDPDGFRIGVALTYRDSGRIDAFLISSSPCL
ncbi:MAG TPA: hypothetical protein VES42_10520 [Pilimelia sp.]|nr:hypothetical protein [Pilimelia sp.]